MNSLRDFNPLFLNFFSIENLRHQISEWESERSILLHFTYSADYEQHLQAGIATLQEELQKAQNELSALDIRKADIKARTEEVRELINAEQKKLRQTENQQKEFERICNTVLQYEELGRKIVDMESACNRLAAQIESEQSEESRIAEIIRECDDKIKHFNDKLTEYQNLNAELKDTSKAEVLSDDYSAMLAEYRMYQERNSANLQELHRQLQKVQKNIGIKEKDIQRFHIESEEYENTVYSDDAYHHAEEQYEQSKKAHEQAEKLYAEAFYLSEQLSLF